MTTCKNKGIISFMTPLNCKTKQNHLDILTVNSGKGEIKFKDYDGENFILDVLDWDNDCKTYIENGGIAVPLTRETKILYEVEVKVINVYDTWDTEMVDLFYYEKHFNIRPEKRAMVIAIPKFHTKALKKIREESFKDMIKHGNVDIPRKFKES